MLSRVFAENAGVLTEADAQVRAGPGARAGGELEDRLRALWARGQSAWPAVELTGEDFARYLAGHLPVDTDPAAFLSEVHPEDVYLACACALGLPAALSAFDQAILSAVPAFVAQVDPSPAFADEVRQLLRTRLFLGTEGTPPRISQYAGTGSLRSWVRTSAVRTALNLRRNQDDLPALSLDRETIGQMAEQMAGQMSGEPEVAVLRAQHHEKFREALRQAFTHLSADQRNLLRLHFVGGLTGEQIATLLRVHRATVVRGLASARSTMFQETRRLLRDRLRLPPADLDSFVRLMRSQLNISLTSLLREQE